MSLKGLNNYHNQGHRVARSNYSMSSVFKSTPPRSSNRKVQKHLDTNTRVEYHRIRDAHRVPLAKNQDKHQPVSAQAIYEIYQRVIVVTKSISQHGKTK